MLEMIDRRVSAEASLRHPRHCLKETACLMSVPIKSLRKASVK